jgi:hypothetical protein
MDATCVIGFGRVLSTAGPPARGLIDIGIVWLLIWWLQRKDLTMSKELRSILKRTLIFTFIEAATLVANGSVMVALQGAELGWLCLLICSGDVRLPCLLALYCALPCVFVHRWRSLVWLFTGSQPLAQVKGV